MLSLRNWGVRLGRYFADVQSTVQQWFGLWKSRPAIDYSRNQYDLWKALYYCSVVNNKGGEYIRGAATAKAIVDATAAFAIGNGFEASIDGADTVPAHRRAQEKLDKWIELCADEIFDLALFAYRDGDSFTFVNEEGEMEDLSADSVTKVVDPITGRVIGYDIAESVTEDFREVIYLRQVRRDSIKYIRLESGQRLEDGRVLYHRIYTYDGLVDPATRDDLTEDEVVEMPLPVVHYANDPDRKALYGNSELQNLLPFYRDYNDVLAGAVTNDSYNNMPIPWAAGATAEAANKAFGDMNRGTALVMNDPQAKAGFLATDKTAQNSGTLLEYIFYNIVQASRTPEFVFGTAVSSSKASVSEQMPVVVKKAEQKRRKLKKVLRALVDAYVFRQMMAGDPDFYLLWRNGVEVKVSFPPIVDEDLNLTKDTIEMLLTKGIISDKTALELSAIGDRIPDADAELEAARTDDEGRTKRTSIYPFDQNRVNDELNQDTNTDV